MPYLHYEVWVGWWLFATDGHRYLLHDADAAAARTTGMPVR